MRLLRYRDLDGTHLGALNDGQVVDLRAVSLADGGVSLPGDMVAFIDMGHDALRRARDLIDHPNAVNHSRPLISVEILAPLQPPRGNVVAVGRNYQAHAEEQARKRGTEVAKPTFFSKAQTSINGPYSDIKIDRNLTQQVDWEAELGVVIGRRGINIQADAALEHVFGYTVINDVSARDIQYEWGGQFFKGKSLDGFCPVGPWIVTADEAPDPQTLQVQLRVNAETKQDANTAQMIFPVAKLIAYLSSGMTLEPANLIATGTPEGVGYARTPQEFLQAGDVMETEVTGIGILRNRIVEAD